MRGSDAVARVFAVDIYGPVTFTRVERSGRVGRFRAAGERPFHSVAAREGRRTAGEAVDALDAVDVLDATVVRRSVPTHFVRERERRV